MLQQKTKAVKASPYEPIRGPFLDFEESFQSKWEDFISKHDHIKAAYDKGDIRFLNVIVEEPFGYRTQFQVMIKNSTIRKWMKLGYLKKPKTQRGSQTDKSFTLSAKKRMIWNKCYLDKLRHLVNIPYSFSFSDYWFDEAWLTNGGHRITDDVRRDDPNDDGSQYEIDFDYHFPFLDLETGEKKVVNLNGCKNKQEIIKKIGITNWDDVQENTFHPVNLYEFSHLTEDEALEDHSYVFKYTNDNLKQIELIHAIHSTTNKRITDSTDWYGWEHKTLRASILKMWDSKKFYINNLPYEFVLRTLLIFQKGIVDNSVNHLDMFCQNESLTDEEMESYWNLLDDTLKLYAKLMKSKSITRHSTRMVEFFTLMCLLKKSSGIQLANIVDEGMFIREMKILIPSLVHESDTVYKKGTDSFHDLRSRSASKAGMNGLMSIFLTRLIDNEVIALLDTRSIKKSIISSMAPICEITGKMINGDEQHIDHFYRKYSLGGRSSSGNLKPIMKQLNLDKEKLGFELTSDFIKMMMNDEKYVKLFTDEKLSYWKNGGMVELEREESSSKHQFIVEPAHRKDTHNIIDIKDFINPPLTIDTFK
jgi:hypothetical protein|tara:strand:+ start:107 stop:1876 length:1770 start_codon:yes stop_codon:yes gene_type:complete